LCDQILSRFPDQPRNARRGGMSSGWYGSRKWYQPSVLVRVITGDFGKHTRHPPRKRNRRERKGKTQRYVPTRGVPVSPDASELANCHNGRAQRPSPTRRILACAKPFTSRHRKTDNARRGGMSSGWYGSRKWCQPSVLVRVITGDFGKHARHPPRERIRRERKGKAQRYVPTRGVPVSPDASELENCHNGRAQRPSPTRNCVIRESDRTTINYCVSSSQIMRISSP